MHRKEETVPTVIDTVDVTPHYEYVFMYIARLQKLIQDKVAEGCSNFTIDAQVGSDYGEDVARVTLSSTRPEFQIERLERKAREEQQKDVRRQQYEKLKKEFG